MFIRFILTLACVCSVALHAQVRLDDEFNDNKTGWPIWDNEGSKAEIKNGKMTFACKTNVLLFTAINSRLIREEKDFVIESTITSKIPHAPPGFGIMFGISNSDFANYFLYAMRPTGKYYYGKQQDGKWVDIIGWQNTDAVKSGPVPNKLRIEKHGKQMRFYLNDKLVDQDRFEPFFGSRLGFWIEGVNEIDIENIKFTETDPSETVAADKQLPGFNSDVDVDNDIPKGKTSGKNTIAVIIGIDKYKRVPGANFSDRDAHVFKEYCTKTLGIEEENIFYRENDQALKSEMDKVFGMDGWLHKRIKSNPDAKVLIFYSGHGAPDEKTKEAYLLPYDIDDNYMAQTAYPLSSLYENLNQMHPVQATVFIDACFSGVSERSGKKENIFAYQKGISLVPKIPKAAGSLSVLTASEDQQSSTAYPEKQHGLFTYYLLKGLQTSAADQDGDKKVTLNELFTYISRNVKSTAAKLDKEQTPTFAGNGKEVFIDLNR